MKSMFLTGYGLSLSVKNSRLAFKQGTFPLADHTEESLELPASACNFDKVIIQGNGYVSTEALQRLAESNINVIMLGKRGNFAAIFTKLPS